MLVIGTLLISSALNSVSVKPASVELSNQGSKAQPLYTGVQRTVALKKFTFVTCHFCHKLTNSINDDTGLYKTIDTYNFDQITPLWIHTNKGTDPMFIQNPEPCVERFYNYYRSSANPYTWIDST